MKKLQKPKKKGLKVRMTKISLVSKHEQVRGTLIKPSSIRTKNRLPGILIIHGWRGNEMRYLPIAEKLARERAICLTINLRGHGSSAGSKDERRDLYSASDHVQDVMAAYKFLVSEKSVDSKRIGAIGGSYGAYLLAMANAEGVKFRWFAFRVPALYPLKNFRKPTASIINPELKSFRRKRISASNHRALFALKRFPGNVLIVGSELDEDVPHETIMNYAHPIAKDKLSLVMMSGADHRLSLEEHREAYNNLLISWVRERLRLVK